MATLQHPQQHTRRIYEPQARERLLARGRALQRWSRVATYGVLILASILTLLPFVWLLSASLKDAPQYFAIPLEWIPVPAHWANFVHVFTDYHFAHYIFNSVWLAVYSVIAEVTISALVAYGFARFRFPGRDALFVLVLATMMIPGQVLTLSLYSIYRDLGWIDTYLPIMVPKLFGSAFLIFLFRQFFIGLPRELDEAAKIDGSSLLGIFWRIILPQARPALITAAVFSFLASWRDAWSPLIYLNSDSQRTLPLGLLYFTSQYGTNYPLLMAATVIGMVVPIILYTLGQRYLDAGISIADVR